MGGWFERMAAFVPLRICSLLDRKWRVLQKVTESVVGLTDCKTTAHAV